MSNIPKFKLWLEFEECLTPPHFDPYDDFFNMSVELADGRRYALNVWTFRCFERARFEPNLESEALLGKYVVAPDLFVEKLDRELIEQVIADMLRPGGGGLKEEWLCPPDECEPTL